MSVFSVVNSEVSSQLIYIKIAEQELDIFNDCKANTSIKLMEYYASKLFSMYSDSYTVIVIYSTHKIKYCFLHATTELLCDNVPTKSLKCYYKNLCLYKMLVQQYAYEYEAQPTK